MNRPLIIPLLVLSFGAPLWSPGTLYAQAPRGPALGKAQPTASDTYLQGYLTMIEGDKKRKSQDFVGAYYKYRDARDTFDAVHAADPGWQPEIIDYRRRKIRESMEEVRQLEVQRRAAGGAPSPSGIIGTGSKTDPGQPLDVREALPASEDPAIPKTPGSMMEEKMRALYQQISRLEKRNEEILKTLGAREEELRRASKEKLESQSSEKQLRERLIKIQDQLDTATEGEKRRHRELLKKVDELQTALNLANEKLVEANASRDKMATDLANAIAEIKQLNTEVTGLRKERDQMVALLTGESGKGMDKAKIVEENQRLRKELADAQEKMALLQKDKDADRTEIASLKEQVRTVQESLQAVQQENEDYRQQIAALTGKLDAASRMLAENGAAEALPESEAIAENNVLREIILQQLKQQARRERARQNIMDELSREGVFEKMKELGVESENILRAVNEMAAPVKLDKAQRDIIASTQVNKLLTSADGKELYIVEDSADSTLPSPDAPIDPSGASDKAGLPTELKAYANAAEEHFRSGDYTSAENNFRKILVVEPQNVYALCNLGVTLLRLNNNEEAAEILLKALAYNYENDFAHYARGVALLRTGRVDDAAEELQEGLKINDKSAPAWHTLGLIAIKRGQYDLAKENFLKAVEIDPSCAEAHFNLAVIYSTSQPIQLDTARRHYKSAISAGAARDSGLDKLLGVG